MTFLCDCFSDLLFIHLICFLYFGEHISKILSRWTFSVPFSFSTSPQPELFQHCHSCPVYKHTISVLNHLSINCHYHKKMPLFVYSTYSLHFIHYLASNINGVLYYWIIELFWWLHWLLPYQTYFSPTLHWFPLYWIQILTKLVFSLENDQSYHQRWDVWCLNATSFSRSLALH